MSELIVFTDLDGSLLDHSSYSFEAALPALGRLRESRIPLILTTSKTPAEILDLKRDLENPDAAIAENGSVILLPRDLAESFSGSPAASPLSGLISAPLSDEYFIFTPPENITYIREVLGGISAKFPFRSFGMMDAHEVSKRTGLSPESAGKALERQASEPLLWQGDPQALNEFQSFLQSQNLRLSRGGRFYHVLGDYTKSDAMKRVRRLYPDAQKGERTLIALGDGPNDYELLTDADFPVWITNPATNFSPPDIRGLKISEHPGPAGWNRAILEIYAEFYPSHN